MKVQFPLVGQSRSVLNPVSSAGASSAAGASASPEVKRPRRDSVTISEAAQRALKAMAKGEQVVPPSPETSGYPCSRKPD